MNTILAILFGIAFGFILQRAGALNYNNILNTLRLKDLTIAKFMFLSVGLSTIGIFSLRSIGYIYLDIIGFNVVATLLGGLIFGVGFAISGYCPGTSIGAYAEGKKDAGYVILGGMLGVLFYTMFQGEIAALFFRYDKGSLMLGDLFQINTLVLAAIYSLVIGFLIYFADRIETKSQKNSDDFKINNSAIVK